MKIISYISFSKLYYFKNYSLKSHSVLNLIVIFMYSVRQGYNSIFFSYLYPDVPAQLTIEYIHPSSGLNMSYLSCINIIIYLDLHLGSHVLFHSPVPVTTPNCFSYYSFISLDLDRQFPELCSLSLRILWLFLVPCMAV